MGDDSEWTKAPTEEKVEHKNWKARLQGYEECCKLFRMCDDPKNQACLNYLGLVKKFVVDTNEVARDKALDAVLAFVENVPAAAKTVGEVLPGLINKCLNGKLKTKEKAFEIIMMYIEAEKQEIVQEELIKGLENKQPKIVQACLEILRRAINEFSSKVIPIKPIIKFVPKLLEDRDKMVRDETKLLAIEMYRWAGAAIMPQLQSIKPALLAELEEEFKNSVANGEKPRQTRFLRSQQDLKAKMEAEMEQKMMNGCGGGDVAVAGNDVIDAAPEAMDPYDLMEPADILSKLPKDFKEKLEAKKWQERKEVLDALLGILQKNPRLVVVDYYDLVNDLKKIVGKDANVNIVIVAAKCITGIASGLRKDFNKYALMALEPLMERFKEKKQHIVDALREACDAIYPSTNLEAIQEMAVGFLGHKTPVVRQQVALFLARCFAMSTQTTLPKKVLKSYLPPLVKNLSEADPTVRDSSSEALGAIYKALGEKIFMPNVGELEQIKIDKIKEYADKCVLLNLRGEPRTTAAAPTAVPTTKPVSASTSSINSATIKKPTITKPGTDSTAAAAKPKTGGAVSSSKPTGDKKVVKGGGSDAKKGAASNSIPEEPDLNQDTVDDRANELFGTETITNLGVSAWKDRLAAIEALTNAIKRMPSDEVPVQIVVRTVAKKPGFKDAHFQVLKQRLELITMIADTGYKFSQRSASYCCIDIADKIGDVKTSQQAKEALSKISEQCTLPYVIQEIAKSIMDGKNPKNQENFLLWISQAIKEFGFQGMDMKSLLNHIKAALQNTNPAVRVASIQLISTIYMYMGASFRSLFDQEKPALLEQIDAEIEKVKSLKPPVPIRGRNSPSAQSNMNGGGGDGDDEAVEEDDPIKQQLAAEAMMPRTDISAQLTDQLMEQLNDKNWKERQAALEKLETILRENKFIEPNLNEFPTHLNKRLIDTNKILAGTALKISEKLAQALGSQGKRFVSILAPGMISALSDNKEALRKTAISALNAWFDNCGGLVPFLENEVLIEAISSATNPNVKAELCGWLTSVLPKCKPGKLPPELKAIIPHVFNFVEDRNPDVRTKAQELILPLMTHVGSNDMMRVMQKAKPTSISVLQPLIEKARGELAAKQPPPSAAAPAPSKPVVAPAKSNVKAAPAKNLYADDDDEYSQPAPPAASSAPAAAKKDAKAPANSKAKEAPAGKAPAASSKKNKNDDEDVGPIMQVSNKQKRIDEEKALKTLKWNFDVPRKEFIDQLKTQMETAGFSRTLMTQLFHDDFKYHIIALQTLTKAIEDMSDATLSNLDLILRWLTLRFFETNPTVIIKAIEYMQALFGMLANVKNYHLVDYEANAFIPYFINKMGDPKDPIRKGFRTIIKQIYSIYAPVKVFNFLIQGLTSKNARQRSECLEELGQMIEALGLNPFNPAATLKEIAKQIGDRDNSVRNAALNTITIAFQIAGEQVYKYIGKLNEKDQSMLDERIKRSSKNPPPSSAAGGVKSSISGPIKTQQQQQQIQQIQQQEPLPNSNSYSSGFNGSTTNLNETINRPNTTTMTRTTPSKRASTTNLANISPQLAAAQQQAQIQALQQKPKGEFCLDIKDDDDDASADIQVKLTPSQDLDELFKPIDLPPRKNTAQYPPNILRESQDCKEAIDLVITHISHQKIDVSFQNLIQIDYVIKDKEKRDYLIPHIDNLLNTCAIKLNVSHNVYLNSHDCQVEEVFKLFKGLFSVIIDIFDNNLGKHASINTLKDLFYNLLSVMVDTKILNYPDGDQLIKAINIVTLKLLELSNQTTCYCALVKLLTDCCDNENVSNRYLELVMKCIWRQIRRLSSGHAADLLLVQQIDSAKVLNEINNFLKMYPSGSWQSKSSDLPLRTVKTLLYHLAKNRQSNITNDLDEIKASEDSEIRVYIMKLFKNGFQLNSSNTSGNVSNMSFGFNTSSTKSIKTNLISPDTLNKNGNFGSNGSPNYSDHLNSIIKKISNVETSKEGLRELYDFKQAHPEIDVNKYFKNSSGKLQSYIQENLKKIEMEQNENGINGSNGSSQLRQIPKTSIFDEFNNKTSSSSSTLINNGNSLGQSRNLEDIMKTIAEYKSKTHLNKLDDDNDENSFKTSNIISSSSSVSSSTNRLLSQYQTNGSSRLNALTGYSSNLNSNGNGSHYVESESAIKAERYLDIVKDLKKKYTRSRTESDQLNDLKQLDLKAKNLESGSNIQSTNQNNIENSNGGQLASGFLSASDRNTSSSNTNINSSNATTTSSGTSENLYDEYKRRLELIKKINPIK